MMSQHANTTTAMAPATVAARCPAQAITAVPSMAATSPATPARAASGSRSRVLAHDGHKRLVVHEGQCRTQNDRREYVCAVKDAAGKHGRRDEYLAERCHVVVSLSPRLNAGITPICWKSSR